MIWLVVFLACAGAFVAKEFFWDTVTDALFAALNIIVSDSTGWTLLKNGIQLVLFLGTGVTLFFFLNSLFGKGKKS